MSDVLRVGLEQGKTWCFASAVDWPEWCRRGKGEDAAVAALLAYADRYQALAAPRFEVGTPGIIGRVNGNATTDLGAPRLTPGTPSDEQQASIGEKLRQDVGPAAQAAGWSPRYFLRRPAWPVLDHAWELQDKTGT